VTRHIFCAAAKDVEAAQRVLALLAQTEDRADEHGRGSEGRGALLARARFTLSLRQRRLALLGNDFSAEAPFDILVALYVSEGTNTIVTITKAAELTAIPLTTVLRWLDHLAEGAWIDRSAVAEDARKARLTLTAKSRVALDQLFG
jgi:DNA-binding MarR family transcriptional regulator